MKFLFVVTAFYPEQAIGSVRVTKFVKYLYQRGHEVTVISLQPPPWAKLDETLGFDELEKIEWHQVPQSRFFQRTMMKSRVSLVGSNSATQYVNSERGQEFSSFLKSKLQFLYTLMKAFDWNGQVKRFAKTYDLGKKQQFDVILTSYPSLGSLLAGSSLKRKKLSKAILMDFRDPVVYGRSSIFGIRRKLETYFLARSDIVTFISEGLRKKILSGFNTTRSEPKTLVLHNGFEEELTTEGEVLGKGQQTDNLPLKFVYTGALYGDKRDLSIFFNALDELVNGSNINARSIEVHYAGAEGDRMCEYVRQMRNPVTVINHGVVTRSAALKLQAEADVCLLATWNTKEDQGILTGKMFEMFALRKPVLGLVAGDLANSEIKEIMDRVGAGYCYETANPQSYAELKAWLRLKWHEKDETGKVLATYNDKVEEFSYSRITSKLEKVLRDYEAAGN